MNNNIFEGLVNPNTTIVYGWNEVSSSNPELLESFVKKVLSFLPSDLKDNIIRLYIGVHNSHLDNGDKFLYITHKNGAVLYISEIGDVENTWKVNFAPLEGGNTFACEKDELVEMLFRAYRKSTVKTVVEQVNLPVVGKPCTYKKAGHILDTKPVLSVCPIRLENGNSCVEFEDEDTKYILIGTIIEE